MAKAEQRQFDGARVFIYPTPPGVARSVAEEFVSLSQEAILQRGRFAVALAGGSTPRAIYELLASTEFKGAVDWARVFVFFGDERCVPPDDNESNYRMAREALLDHVPIPPSNIFRMKGELAPADAATEYEKELRKFFPSLEWPRFDLILLGMGDDGHTASLFPGTDALNETERWVVSNHVEKLHTDRLTLTLPAINHAARIIFTVTGDAKTPVLKRVLKPASDTDKLPASRVRAVDGTTEWHVDQRAARDLE
jgi:6-phosphogluconolactonase